MYDTSEGHPVLDDQPDRDVIVDLYERAASTGWDRDGICARYQGAAADQWFPDDRRNTVEYKEQVAEAIKLCRLCPVMDLCLAASLARKEEFGVWGAIDERTRDDVLEQGKDATRALLLEAVEHTTATWVRNHEEGAAA